MPTPRVNMQLVEQLDPYFQRRRESQFALKSYASSVNSFPVTRGAWTLGNVGYTAAGQAKDSSGNANHLTNSNGVDFTRDELMPYAQFVRASNMALTLPDGGALSPMDILGNEGFVPAAEQGLSICGWVYFDTLTGATQYTVASKWGATGPVSSWLLDYFNNIRFSVYTSLGATVTATSTVALAVDTWYFIQGQLDRPGNKIGIKVNDNSINTANVAAATILNDATVAFQLGGKNSIASAALDGRLSGWNYSAIRLDNNSIARYHNERAGFGV